MLVHKASGKVNLKPPIIGSAFFCRSKRFIFVVEAVGGKYITARTIIYPGGRTRQSKKPLAQRTLSRVDYLLLPPFGSKEYTAAVAKLGDFSIPNKAPYAQTELPLKYPPKELNSRSPSKEPPFSTLIAICKAVCPTYSPKEGFISFYHSIFPSLSPEALDKMWVDFSNSRISK